MYWICLAPDELERVIGALYLVYKDGVGDDQEAAEEQETRVLAEKLERIRDHEK